MNATISVNRGSDYYLTVNLVPQTPISGFSIQFESLLRFGGISGRIVASVASGYNNVSGINVTNGATGQFVVYIPATATTNNSNLVSGYNYSGVVNLSGPSYLNYPTSDYDAYAYQITRVDSGYTYPLCEGYLNLIP